MVTISIRSDSPPAMERRAYPRYACQAGAEVKLSGTAALWGTATDLSRFGCYVETPSPLAAGSEVTVTLNLFERSFIVQARVVVSHPMFGMGLRFESAVPESVVVLEDTLRRLAEEAAAPAPKTASAPPAYRALPRLSGETALRILEEINRHLAEKKVLTLADFKAMMHAHSLHKAMPI